MGYVHHNGVSVGDTGLAVGKKGKETRVLSGSGVFENLVLGIEKGIDLSGGDVVLTAAQAANSILEVDVGHASNSIIAPDVAGRVYVVVNNDGALAAHIKRSGGTAVVVAAGKKALVYHNDNEYVRLTADA